MKPTEFSDIDPHPSLEEQEVLLQSLNSRVTPAALQTLLHEKLGLDLASFSRLDKSQGVNNPIYFLKSTSGRQFVLRLRNTHKYWRKVRTTSEVNTMRLVKASTTIPVPTILDFSADETTSVLFCEYMLMDRMPGETLADLIPRMTYAQRLAVLGEVLACIKELQNIPLEAGVPEQVGAFSVQPGDYKSLGPVVHDGPSLGPFRDFADYCVAHVRHALFCIRSEKGRFDHLVPPLEEFARDVKFAPTRNVLCHLDLNQGNLLVDPVSMKLTAVLDWEHAHIFPWELEYYPMTSCADEYGLTEKDVELLHSHAGIMLGVPNKEIKRADRIVNCAKGLHFFCASWYLGRERKEDRIADAIHEGVIAGEELAGILKSVSI